MFQCHEFLLTDKKAGKDEQMISVGEKDRVIGFDRETCGDICLHFCFWGLGMRFSQSGAVQKLFQVRSRFVM